MIFVSVTPIEEDTSIQGTLVLKVPPAWKFHCSNLACKYSSPSLMYRHVLAGLAFDKREREIIYV